jgi:hypothetical protein
MWIDPIPVLTFNSANSMYHQEEDEKYIRSFKWKTRRKEIISVQKNTREDNFKNFLKAMGCGIISSG